MRRKLFRVGMVWRPLVALVLALCLVPIGSSPVAALSIDDYFEITYEPVEFSKTEINGSEVFNATITVTATRNDNALPLPVTEAWITARVTATHQVSFTKVTLNEGYTVTISPFPQKGETSSKSVDVSLQFPQGSESGTYNVVGVLDKAEVKVKIGILTVRVPVKAYLPPFQAMGSVTYTAPGVDVGDFAPALTPTAEEVKTNLFGTEASFPISSSGEILETIEATSEDGMLTLTIPGGTIALDEDDNPLISLEAEVDISPPPPPKDTSIIGLAYDFGPDEATFDPPITLTWSYDPNDIPEGVAEEDLVLAWYDEAGDKWVELDSVVDPETNTITAEVSHFTAFTALAYTRPAAFAASDLSIFPTEVDIGETVTIRTLVTNIGNLTGTYEVTLKIDDVVVATKEVTLVGGASQRVTFTITKDVARTYTVNVNGLVGTFVVRAPAAFVASGLSITPAEVDIGETVTISALVTNTGDLTGTYEVTLKIDDVVVATEEVTLAGGARYTVTFKISENVARSYSVNINDLSGSFVVKPVAISEPEPVSTLTPPVTHTPPAKPINWLVVGGVIAAVVVVGLLIFFLARRSHTKSS